MSDKHPGPLVVEGKLADAERLKKQSNYLRGTIKEDLEEGLTGGFTGDNFLLIRFHGMYQQDDRDIRAERAEQKLEPRHAMMLRWMWINERFQTLQGEGYYTGVPAIFIRLQGCPVGCSWCDTKHTWEKRTDRETSLGDILIKTVESDAWGDADAATLVSALSLIHI